MSQNALRRFEGHGAWSLGQTFCFSNASQVNTFFLVLDSIGLHARSEACAHGWLARSASAWAKRQKRMLTCHTNADERATCCEAPALRDKSCQRGVYERQDPMLGRGGNEEGCFGCVEGEFFFFNVECFYSPPLSLFLIRKVPWESQRGADWICPRSNTQLLEGGEIKTPSFSSQPPRMNITWWIFVPH